MKGWGDKGHRNLCGTHTEMHAPLSPSLPSHLTLTSRQYAREEKERQRQEAQENYQALMQAEEVDFVTNTEDFDCPVCYTAIPAGEGVRLRGCLHQFCK